MLDERFRVVVPSRKRSDTVMRHTLALMPYATVTVEESEVDEYAKVLPREQILAHPPMSMIAIHNWIHDNVKAEFLIVAYDDLREVRCNVGWRPRFYRDPGWIAELLETTAVCAKDAGCSLFGFGHHHNKTFYSQTRPFRLNSYVKNVLGFVGDEHGLRWDPFCRLHGDVDLALQALLKHRIIWRDDRFIFIDTPMASNKGGQVSRRSTEQMRQADANLIEKWGRYVRISTRNTGRANAHSRTQATMVIVPRRDPAIRGGA